VLRCRAAPLLVRGPIPRRSVDDRAPTPTSPSRASRRHARAALAGRVSDDKREVFISRARADERGEIAEATGTNANTVSSRLRARAAVRGGGRAAPQGEGRSDGGGLSPETAGAPAARCAWTTSACPSPAPAPQRAHPGAPRVPSTATLAAGQGGSVGDGLPAKAAFGLALVASVSTGGYLAMRAVSARAPRPRDTRRRGPRGGPAPTRQRLPWRSPRRRLSRRPHPSRPSRGQARRRRARTPTVPARSHANEPAARRGSRLRADDPTGAPRVARIGTRGSSPTGSLAPSAPRSASSCSARSAAADGRAFDVLATHPGSPFTSRVRAACADCAAKARARPNFSTKGRRRGHGWYEQPPGVRSSSAPAPLSAALACRRCPVSGLAGQRARKCCPGYTLASSARHDADAFALVRQTNAPTVRAPSPRPSAATADKVRDHAGDAVQHQGPERLRVRARHADRGEKNARPRHAGRRRRLRRLSKATPTAPRGSGATCSHSTRQSTSGRACRAPAAHGLVADHHSAFPNLMDFHS